MNRFLCGLMLAVVSFAGENDSFRLSMDKVNGTIGAIKGLVETFSTDPALHKRFMAAKKNLKADTNGRDSISMTSEAIIASEPKIAAVYRKAGITPKVAGMTMETLIGVIFGEAMMQSTGKEANLPAGFVADNFEFYKQNKAAIQAAFGELKALSGKVKLDDEDEEKDSDEGEEDETEK